MKKLLPILLLSALLLAACGGGGAVAATVDDTAITVNRVESLINTEGSTVAVELFAQFLGFEIQTEIVSAAALDQFGIEFTDEEIAAEADVLYGENAQGQTREEFVAALGVTEEFLLVFAERGLIETAVGETLAADLPAPTQEEIDAEMEAVVADVTEVCVSHILVPTQEEADDALERVTAGGEEFGVVASELSQDTGSAANNGILPCTTAGTYVPEFRDASVVAPVGEVYEEIVESQFGFHILLVTDRVDPDEGILPTEADVIEAIGLAAGAEATNTWALEQITIADVTVDEQYGTWNPSPPQPGVIPPSTP